jgi:amino acid adenylation domain-containing protein
MSAVSLLSKLRELGITLRLVNDKLKITGAESKLTPALIDELKNKKAEIVAFLQENVQKRLKYESIGIVETKEYYKLSSPQKRLYILQQMNLHSTAYNMPEVIPFSAASGLGKMHEAFKELIKRHESLRTSFHMINDAPVQKIHHDVEFEVENYRVKVEVKVEEERSSLLEGTRGLAPLSIEPAARSPQPVTALIISFIRPFDLSRAPLLRVGLLKTGEGRHLLMVDMPHIISDGVSRRILVEDFTALTAGKELPILRLQYKDYVEWLNNPRQQAVVAKQETYWLHRFKGEIPVLNLPIDYTRPQIQSFEGSTVRFIISKEDTRQLKELAVKTDVTLYMVLLAIYDVFLYKVTGQEDAVVGTGSAGRRHHDLQDIMGIFVNTLVIRNYPKPGQSFVQFLKEVKKTTLEVFENQEYPFEELVEKVDPRKDTSRNPLFDTMLMLQNIEIPGNTPRTPAKDTAGTAAPPGMTISDYDHGNTISKFDLTLFVSEVNGELHCYFEYCTRLFKPGTIGEFINYIKEVAVSAAADPGQSIKEITRVSRERKEAIIRQLNRELQQEAAGLIEPGETLQSKLNRSFKEFPDRVAIEKGEQTVTYSELNRKAGKITQTIIEKGIPRATCIGILLENREELIAVMVGILEAGSVFVPLDASYPRQRLDAMIRAAGIRLMVTDSVNDGKWDESVESIHLHRLYSSSAAAPKISPAKLSNDWEDCIYIYFTSGTTGTPRAMMGKNGSLLHFINWEISTFGINEGNRFSQFIAPVFDAFLRDVLVPLLSGGVICIPQPNEIMLQSSSLTRWVERSRIHLIHCVPSLFRLLIPGEHREHRDYTEKEAVLKLKFKELKYILLSGERINPRDLSGWYEIFKERIQLVNLWGTSETTLAKTYYLIQPADIYRERIPVGKPLPGARVVVLDENLEICDPLVKGQLYIKTPFRTLGYHNEPALNRERFIPDPFTHDTRILLHKTGDQGRMLADGTIDVAGRDDRQVKIHGVRVELEEIESVLGRHERVKEVVVLKRKISDTDELLCAYITENKSFYGGSRGAVFSKRAPLAVGDKTEEYRLFLSERLPSYMVPGKLIILEKMPRKPNGKVDDDALPDPLAAAPVFQTPRDAVEKKLLELWSDILKRGKEQISVTHSFFELGGNSLHIMTLIARLHREFDVRVTLGEIFTNPTLRGQANIIRAAAPVRYASIEPVEKREYYPQSSAQKRLFFLNRIDETGMTYHMNGIFALPGEIDKQRCENAFRESIARHESMRTSFLMIDGEPVQRIHNKVEVEVEYYDREEVEVEEEEQKTEDRGQTTEDREQTTEDKGQTTESKPANLSSVIRHLSSEFIRPFDLTQAPLVRMGVVEISPQQYLLMFDMHHIISDGTSETILKEDFTRFYNDETPGMLRLQYKDFSLWQNGEKERETLKRQEEYWLKEFEGEIPVLDLPGDYPRPMMQSFEGNNVNLEFSTGESRALNAAALEGGATLFMVLAAVFNILLSKLSGQEEIIMGTPVACRRHADLEKIIGMFVNTLSLRNYPAGDRTFREFLADVKEKTLKAFENQEYPFEELVDKLSVKRDIGRNPLFDIMLVLQNMDTEIGSASREKETGYKTGQPVQPDFPGDKEYENIVQTAKFDLSIVALERDRGLFLSFQYCTKLFRKETIERFTIYYKKIAAMIVKEPDIRISDIEIVSEEERNRLLYEFNDTGVEYPKDKTIHRLFEEQVENIPDRVALVGPGLQRGALLDLPVQPVRPVRQLSLTYRELNERSNRLAGLLIEKGVQPDTIVGIMMERSIDMIIGILGILKAGGAYLPIDTDYPEDRIDFMLKDSSARILLTTGNIESVINRTYLSYMSYEAEKMPATSLAYVIYTSGSTGKPKGVMAEHRNVVRLVKNAGYIHYSMRDRLLPTGSAAFDISTFEIWGPLLNGVMLWLESKEVILNAGIFKEVLVKYDISILHLIPLLFNQMAAQDMEIFGGLRYFLVGGDLVKPGAINRLRNSYPHLKIIHCCGPTENTTFSTTFQVDKDYDIRIPIGKPIDNSSAYILDKYNHLQPVGVPGELCVGGDGIARGYLNNPELTADKFDHDLWDLQDYHDRNNRSYRSHQSYISYLSYYKTGDLAQWLPDGNIEFLGRADSQVKVRGYRVELREVESRLSGYSGIKEVVVVSRESEEGDKQLCAYFVPFADDSVSISALREHLTAVLPPYMVPSYFVPLERMPLLVSGKIDRKALPMPDRSGTGTETLYAEPGTGLEETIAAVWKKVLKLDRVGVNDHFFSIGGNSFNILQVNTQLKKLNMRDIPVAKMFQYTTIRELARFLEGDDGGEGPAAEEEKLFQAIDKGKSKLRKRIANRKRS